MLWKWLEVPVTPFKVTHGRLDDWQPTVSISLSAIDRPGIVKDVSEYLCDHGFVITGMKSEVSTSESDRAPDTPRRFAGADGEDRFILNLDVILPRDSVSQGGLIKGLNDIGCQVKLFEV